jgi:hypothetical protein
MAESLFIVLREVAHEGDEFNGVFNNENDAKDKAKSLQVESDWVGTYSVYEVEVGKVYDVCNTPPRKYPGV